MDYVVTLTLNGAVNYDVETMHIEKIEYLDTSMSS